MTFEHSLTITVIDKLLIALILLVAGFFITRAVELWKSKLALGNEMAKQRVGAISECWSKFYVWEANVREAVRQAAQIQLDHQGNSQGMTAALQTTVATRLQLSEKQSADARDAVERSRFWLGEELYSGFRDYHNRVIDYMTVYARGDLAAFQRVESQIEAARHDIIKMRDKL